VHLVFSAVTLTKLEKASKNLWIAAPPIQSQQFRERDEK